MAMVEIGNEIDLRGIMVDLDEGDYLSDIIVVAEIIKADGESQVVTSRGEMTNWLKEAGMLKVANED